MIQEPRYHKCLLSPHQFQFERLFSIVLAKYAIHLLRSDSGIMRIRFRNYGNRGNGYRTLTLGDLIMERIDLF